MNEVTLEELEYQETFQGIILSRIPLIDTICTECRYLLWILNYGISIFNGKVPILGVVCEQKRWQLILHPQLMQHV